MKPNIMIAGKKLMKASAEKLAELSEKENAEHLRKQMERLFTFKNTYAMHDDHIKELADCIVDLWRSEDRAESAREMEDYAKSQMSRHGRKKREMFHRVQWAKAAGNEDEAGMLDLKYRLWIYEHGYEHSRFQMYGMLCRITQNLLRQ